MAGGKQQVDLSVRPDFRANFFGFSGTDDPQTKTRDMNFDYNFQWILSHFITKKEMLKGKPVIRLGNIATRADLHKTICFWFIREYDETKITIDDLLLKWETQMDHWLFDQSQTSSKMTKHRVLRYCSGLIMLKILMSHDKEENSTLTDEPNLSRTSSPAVGLIEDSDEEQSIIDEEDNQSVTSLGGCSAEGNVLNNTHYRSLDDGIKKLTKLMNEIKGNISEVNTNINNGIAEVNTNIGEMTTKLDVSAFSALSHEQPENTITGKTFAEAAKSKKSSTAALIIKTKDKITTDNLVKKIVNNAKNDASYKLKTIKATNNGIKLIINNNDDDIEKIKKDLNQQSIEYQEEKMNQPMATFIMSKQSLDQYDMNQPEDKFGQLFDSIRIRNNMEDEDFVYVHHFTRKDKIKFLVRLSNGSKQKLGDYAKLYWIAMMINLYDHFNVIHCNHCLSYGHTTRFCKERLAKKPATCKRCGEHHETETCQQNEFNNNCYHCKKQGKDDQHRCFTFSCPLFKRAAFTVMRYSEYDYGRYDKYSIR